MTLTIILDDKDLKDIREGKTVVTVFNLNRQEVPVEIVNRSTYKKNKGYNEINFKEE